MLAVAIPAPLAKIDGGPQVVPVDSDGHSQQFLSVALVGQRVALAWRETCPTCDGRNLIVDNLVPGFPGVGTCSDCTNGERMVVGWTAEVERVDFADGYERRYPMVPWRGQYALVLRDVKRLTDTHVHGAEIPPPARCRPFDGFVELDTILNPAP